MTFILDAIFTGTWGITAALLVVQLFRLKLQINPVIINSISVLLLIGSSFYLLTPFINFIHHYYSGGEYERYTFKNGNFLSMLMVSGVWLFNYGILPQLLWIKKLRRLSTLVVIICIWAITSLFIPWGLSQFFLDHWTDNSLGQGFKFEFSTLDYLEQAAVYAIAFAVVYSIISRRNTENANTMGAQHGVEGDIE